MDIKIERKHAKLKKYLLITTGILLIAGVIIWAAVRSTKSTYRADRNVITIDEVVEGEFEDYLRLNGRVETGTIVQVSAMETGIVQEKLKEEGAMVEAGDILVVLHNPTLRQQILDSESQLAEKQNMLRDTEIAMEKDRLDIRQQLITARTELAKKRRAKEQQEALYNEQLTSREEYLQAKENYELAAESLKLLQDRLRQDSLYRSVQVAMMQESLHNMEENFKLVRERADNLNIRASHSGQLGTLNVELGQSVSSGQQVGQINILDNYKITVKIDEHYIDRIVPGLSGSVDRQGHSYEVSVKKVYPEVADRLFKADLTLVDSVPQNIRVGQTLYTTLLLDEPVRAVMVPRGTFFQSTGGKWAYVLDPDGHSAVKRRIKIGRQNPKYYEVVEGLSPGERIITSSYNDFGDADRIEIE